ncbi:MAG: VWA domain-containing protein [Deltaproteobacteria bacterium]|nr:VWA domain-containing protein [Deltaproteobacteria bacterium]
MLIVYDASGWMDGQDGVNGRNAVQFLLANYSTKIRWGLMLFSADSNCAAGTVNVGVGDNTSSAIMTTINARGPAGGAPTADTLFATNWYTGLHDPARLNYVMFIVGGNPTCTGNTVETTTSAAANLFASGIKTFIVGNANPTEANLMLYAQAGGTISPYLANDQTSLQNALTTIAETVIRRPCQNACGSGTESCDLGTNKWANCTAPTNCCTDTNAPCSTGKPGICGDGLMKCVGFNLTCVQTNQPQTEQCGGLDYDCDGVVGDAASETCQNACGNQGHKFCPNGQWTQCDTQ